MQARSEMAQYLEEAWHKRWSGMWRAEMWRGCEREVSGYLIARV